MRLTRALTLILAVAGTAFAADLPSPKSGGPGGDPINLLVISSTTNKVPLIDPVYEAELKAAGYNLHVVSREAKFSLDYLKQFGAVVLANLPYAGAEYTVFGFKLRFVAETQQLLHRYVEQGGGMLVVPMMSEFGEAYGWTYDRFLAPYDARFLIHQLKAGDARKNEMGPGSYGVGTLAGGHDIVAGLKGQKVLYPTNVMRWDHSYSCTPVLTGNGWTTLASADDATTHTAIDNSQVGEPLTKENTLYAVRRAGKGMVAVSAIHSYYTLTMVSSKEDHIGENGTGVIDFKVMRGEPDGRSSAFGKLLDHTYRALAANSAANGIGAWQDLPLPDAPPLPQSDPVIDWSTQQPPPTWRHRVIPSEGWPKTYDELPDPTIKGEMQYWKLLIGPKTAYSSGAGKVKAYREAAQAAGYSAIAFAETFEEMTPRKWQQLLADCKANSDDSFVCLPGLDILSTEGQRYLVLGAERYPARHWLAEDGKRLQAIRMLSLGWFGHVSVVHRPAQSPLHYKTFKHYTGIGVATYDTKGKQVDDGMKAYRWAQAVDSSAVPIAVHEVTRPADVKHAVDGFQQILPAPTLAGAIRYFRFGFAHSFDAPMRYFISEGPILDGWSLFNKDRGKAQENRWQFRMGIGVRAADGETPITSVKLYDELETVRHWQNTTPAFSTVVDGTHNKQHCFILEAADAKGRRVLSPLLRTVSRNWRLRCADKQNWLGSQLIYTGWWLNGLPGYNLQIAESKTEGNARNAPAILDFPFFSDHVQINDADLGWHMTQGVRQDIAGDAKGMLPVALNEHVRGNVRYTYFSDLKRKDFAVLMVETTIALSKEATVEPGLNPWIGTQHNLRYNNALILPNGPVDKLGKLASQDKKIREQGGNKANLSLDLPVGTYVGGIVPLTPGLHLEGRQLGFKGTGGTMPAGTTWNVRYLMLRDRLFKWKNNRGRNFNREVVDQHAEQALTDMGFRGKLPYQLKLKQGTLERTEYVAYLTAKDGGVAGKNINRSGREMLMHVPLAIAGLDADSEMVLWRSDSEYLEPFAAYDGRGYVTFNADKDVTFYAGNVAVCDPGLAVSMVAWDKDTAHFRVHNPTDRAISCTFATAAPIKGFKRLKTKITVPAGTSIDVQ
jgi:hypothetical protein